MTNSENLLITSFKDYHKLIGGYIKTYIACEIKKRAIIQAAGDHQTDELLCRAYSYAQNNILMEIMFLYLTNSELKKVLGGEILTTNKKKTKRRVTVLKKGGKKSKTSGKSKTKMKGGKPFKLKPLISLFLLLSLKSYSETTMENSLTNPGQQDLIPGFVYDPSEFEKFDTPNIDTTGINTMDIDEMLEYTKRFGKILPVNASPLKSTNLTKQFYKHSKSLHWLSQFTTLKFHEEVMDATEKLFNVNIVAVHESLLKVCNVFIDKLSDTNPDELYGEYFTQFKEQGLLEHKNNLVKLEQRLSDQIEINALALTGIPQTYAEYFFGESNKKSGELATLYTSDDKEKYVAQERKKIKNYLDSYNAQHEENTKNTIRNLDDTTIYRRNRREYLAGVCRISFQTPMFEYNKTEGSMFYTNFPKHRSLIDVIIRNVKGKNERMQLTANNKEDPVLIAKQIEMAEFLEELLFKMDETFKKIILSGHLGKQSMSQYFDGIKHELAGIDSFASMGFNGVPNDMREALRQRQLANASREINNIVLESRQIEEDDRNKTRAMDNKIMKGQWDYGLNTVTTVVDYMVKPFDYAFEGAGNRFTNAIYFLLYQIVLAGSGILLIGATYHYFCVLVLKQKMVTNKKGPAIQVAPTIQIAPTIVSAPAAIKESAPAATKESAPATESEPEPAIESEPVIEFEPVIKSRPATKSRPAIDEEAALSFLQKRPNVLKPREKNGRCPKNFTYVQELQNCIPSAYIRDKKRYIAWYLSDTPDDYAPLADDV